MAGRMKNLLHVTSREEWRAWLARHYRTESEAWLVYHRTGSGKPRISYNDAVEEALCFGWVDSTAKGIDERRFAQRFSPRRPGSPYSAINMERLRRLAARGLIRADVRKTLPDLSVKRFRTPSDIVAALKERPQAWRNYRKLPAAYKRIRIGFIEGARDRPGEFQKRLRYFVRMTERNKRFGFGGVEGYFEDEEKEA
jgi:uncharacterized protein YdeI (YjbR/CyaY-like superfamily)